MWHCAEFSAVCLLSTYMSSNHIEVEVVALLIVNLIAQYRYLQKRNQKKLTLIVSPTVIDI